MICCVLCAFFRVVKVRSLELFQFLLLQQPITNMHTNKGEYPFLLPSKMHERIGPAESRDKGKITKGKWPKASGLRQVARGKGPRRQGGQGAKGPRGQGGQVAKGK